MASKLGPRIVTDNLVLALDCADAKSYAGEPTTNLLGSNDNPLNGMSNITLTKIETQADGWIKYSMSGTFTGGTYPYMSYIDTVSFTGGTAYTSRAMIKTNVESKFNYFGSTGINYVNQPLTTQGTSRSVATEENGLNVYTVSREGFVYTSTTTQRGYLFTNPINNTTFSSSTDFMWIKNVQVEQKTYPTPWVYASRSATDGWVDLSGNSNDGTLVNGVATGTSHYRSGDVILPNSVRYLNFDGTNDYISIPQFDFTSTHSLEWWFNTDNLTEKYTGGYAGHMLCWGHSPSERIQLRTNGGIRIYIHDSSTGTTFDTSNFSVTAGDWTHITATLDWVNKSVKFYQNGVLKDTISFSSLGSWNYTGASNPYDYIDFGRNVNNNNIFFDGKLASIKIYNKVLTAAEVLDNYNSTKSRFS